MAVSPPPRKSTSSESATRRQPDDKQIEAIINRGSSTVATPTADQPLLKNFNVKLPAAMLAQIDEVRAQRPRKPTSPKLGISTQDWLLEAVAEKLEREQRKYKLK